MATALASNFHQGDFSFDMSSGSHSPSRDSSPNPRHASGSMPYLNVPGDSYFGDAVYESPIDTGDSELLLRRLPRKRSADHGDHWSPSNDLLVRHESSDSGAPSPSQSVSSLSSTYTSYDPSTLVFEEIVDRLLVSKPSPFMFTGPRNLFMFDPGDDEKLKHESIPPLMIKRLKNSSVETHILFSTHNPSLRDDPWNAVPHILGVVERGDWVYICMKQLSEYNNPPLLTVEHYVDFFRQVLERLTFLHEHNISGLSLADPSSYMMDLSSAPLKPADDGGDKQREAQFDRFKYPVHYYFVNFSKASRPPRQTLYPASTPVTPTFGKSSSFTQDIRECGMMFESLIANVPQIAETFAPLLQSMDQGHFNLEQFETLLATVDRELFETTAVESLTPNGKGMDKNQTNPETIFDSPQLGSTSFSLDRSLSH